MAYCNKMKDNEMNLVYKYYGNFTAKENYLMKIKMVSILQLKNVQK